MYTFEEKMKAVNLHIKYHHKAAPVIRELGYPERHMLVKCHKQYEAAGTLPKQMKGRQKFTEQQKQIALQHYWERGQSIACTIWHLGYLGITIFKNWLNEAYPDHTKHCISGGAIVEYPQKKKNRLLSTCVPAQGLQRKLQINTV